MKYNLNFENSPYYYFVVNNVNLENNIQTLNLLSKYFEKIICFDDNSLPKNFYAIDLKGKSYGIIYYSSSISDFNDYNYIMFDNYNINILENNIKNFLRKNTPLIQEYKPRILDHST